MEEVIGKGTWLDKVAYKLIEREKKIGRDVSLVRVESGLGASGIPHIGSLGDAVRAYGIKLALENLGYRSELIAYSDDMDGLRKVPEGLPDWLKEYIAKPVSTIPDPFSCHRSYGMHMSSMLLDALDKLNIKYRFQSGTDTYREGKMIDQIDTILRNAKVIGENIAAMVGQEKFLNALPYFPVCESCKRLYTTVAYEYISEEKKVRYRCKEGRIGKDIIQGCGYEGEADIRTNSGKLGWKVEFAARWQAFDIRFEAYGKDIADSVRVNDWVSDNILKYQHPMHVKYEMFLDKSGKKISKSLGNVLTPQAWLRYGTPQSIMLLLFKRIVGTRHIGLDDIPKLMDEYNYLEDVYFNKVAVDNEMKRVKMRGIYEYINHGKASNISIHIPYMLLVNLASLVREDRVAYVIKRLQSYGMIKDADEELISRIKLAANWADDFGQEIRTISISEKEKSAVKMLIDLIDKEGDAKVIQAGIFNIARSNGIEPKDFFKLIYNMLLNSDKGPRLGPYIIDLGREKVIEGLRRHL